MKKAISILLMVSFVLAMTASAVMANPHPYTPAPSFTAKLKINSNIASTTQNAYAVPVNLQLTHDWNSATNFGAFGAAASGTSSTQAAVITQSSSTSQQIIDNDFIDNS